MRAQDAACRRWCVTSADIEESEQRCGICDFCDPEGIIGQQSRQANAQESANALRILEVLKKSDGLSTGRLHTQVFPDGLFARREFEELLGAMARSGLVEIADASFEKDGRQIDYRKARITAEGRTADASTPLLVAIEIESDPRGRKRKAAKKKLAKRKETVAPGSQSAIEAALRAWRLAEAKSKAIPAFRILTDRVLQAIAVKQPRTAEELIEISGVGQSIVQKYATQIFRIIGKAKIV